MTKNGRSEKGKRKTGKNNKDLQIHETDGTSQDISKPLPLQPPPIIYQGEKR